MISDASARRVFLARLIAGGTRQIDLAADCIWASIEADDVAGMTASAIIEALESAGTAAINKSRLIGAMSIDKRFVKTRNQAIRISPRERQRLDRLFADSKKILPIPDTGSILPSDLFSNAYKYVRSVVRQINVSYDKHLFDACAVMCRRLFETLIIEAYEKQGAINRLRKPDGELMQLLGMIQVLEQDSQLGISRQTKQAARKLKDIGDWSAHSRRHIAIADDIDRVRDQLRVACGDLLHLSGQD